MAYVKTMTTTNAIASLRYGEHEKSVVRGSVDCPEDTEQAIKYFASDRAKWHKQKGVQAHIVIMSFKGREVTPEEAVKIAEKFVCKIAPGHRAMIYAHSESEGGNIHCHIVISAVNQHNGSKINSHGFLYKSRKIANELCEESGLSVIKKDENEEKKDISVRYTLAEKEMIKKGKVSWKNEIRNKIEEGLEKMQNTEDFKKFLKNNGISISERLKKKDNTISWTYIHKNGMKVRGRTLGDDYTREFIVKNFKEKDFSSFTSVKTKSAVNAKADVIMANAKNDARNDVIVSKARQITRQIADGRTSTHNIDIIRGQISVLSQALSILQSGSGGSVNLGLEMTRATERAEIEQAINILQSNLSSEMARAEASIVLNGR